VSLGCGERKGNQRVKVREILETVLDSPIEIEEGTEEQSFKGDIVLEVLDEKAKRRRTYL
jgi:saccharopine dehydrogenase-like NADP-dependent oxidoreductase